MGKMMAPATLFEREAARYLEISLDRLRHEVNSGRLGYLGTRARRRFPIEQLDTWWALFRSRPWMAPKRRDE